MSDNIKSLLPCPFCGEGVHHVQDNGKVWMGTRYSEPVSVSIVHWCPEIDGQPSRRIERIGRDYESAAAAWNRRAPVAYSAMAKDAPGNCHKCGLPLSVNPHPEAGKPPHYLSVGCPKECIPCLSKSRHGWAQQAMNDAKDARRYRWLRNTDPQPARELDVCNDFLSIIDGKELDEAIDAAIAASAAKGGA